MADNIKFPKDFLWGASSSAHQLEGGLHNHWTVWELENAKSLAIRAPYRFKHLEAWAKISREAQNPNNYVSGRAVDHFNRYEEDLQLAKQMNLNALRFGIEWSRVEPKEGEWDISAIEHYKNYIKKMKGRGITPVVTFFHFTLPTWFVENGGFEKRGNVKYFARFVERVLDEIGGEISWITTINEPTVYVNEGYWAGDWPPHKTKKLLGLWVALNLLLAHKKVYKLTSGNPRYKISMAHHMVYFYAGDDAWLSRASAWVADLFVNRLMLRMTKGSSDFIAVNYYFSYRVFGYRAHNSELNRLDDLGLDMQPDSLQYLLEGVGDRYNLPVMVTENGLPDLNDDNRKWWISESVKAIHEARKSGVKVIGYLHRSLLDSFEWDKGFLPKFGLVSVNRSNMKRTIKDSGLWFGRLIKRFRNN